MANYDGNRVWLNRSDGDGKPNTTDPDDDNDGVPDGADPARRKRAAWQ